MFLDWIANKLEDIDQQAAASAKAKPPNDEAEMPTLELEALRSKVARYESKITSLEEQLSKLENSNAHYASELRECESRHTQLTESNQQLQSELARLRTSFKSLERKQEQESAAFQQALHVHEETRERMQKEIAALSQELSETQLRLSVTTRDCDRLRTDYAAQREESAKLESEMVRYRERALESLTIDAQDSAVLAQLEVLESERTRLKDGLAKLQQRINQMEAAGREYSEQMHREMADAKQQQTMVEAELLRAKTQNEAMTHEIALLKADLVTSHEAIEARYKDQIATERSKHRTEIARLKEQFSNESRNSAEEQLLTALAQIDSLKSEKVALMVMLQSQKANADQSLLMDVGIRNAAKKSKFRPLAAVVPRELNCIHRNLARTDVLLGTFFAFFGVRPVARSILLLWIVAVHVIVLLQLF
jgi:chromosome segregation ATPase